MKRPTLYSGILWALGMLALCGWLAGCNTTQQKTASYVRASMADTQEKMKAKRAELEQRVHDAANPQETVERLKELAAFDEAEGAFTKANTLVQQTLNEDGTINTAGVAVAVATAVPVPYGPLAGLGVGLVYGIIERQRQRARDKKAAEIAAKANADASKVLAGTAGT